MHRPLSSRPRTEASGLPATPRPRMNSPETASRGGTHRACSDPSSRSHAGHGGQRVTGDPKAGQRRRLLVAAGLGPALMSGRAAFGAGRPTAAAAGFYAQPLDEAAGRLGFALTDTRGRLRRSTDFSGQVLVLFFGFLSCPSICPTTMLELSAAQKAMGPRADLVTIAFATLDPERDSAVALEAWLAVFGKRHVGLRDSADAVRRAAATLKLEYTRVPGASPDAYTIDHGVQAYVFDPRGRLRLLLRPGPLPREVAADWQRLLDGA